MTTEAEEQAEEYRRWVSETNVIVAGGAPKIICPLCNDTHPICRFQAGLLACATTNCTNPHHRPYAEVTN